jgi:hypothetical protein
MTFMNDYAKLKEMGDAGNIEAALILELMKKGRGLRTKIDGITQAMGIKRDHDEILAGVIEDMLGELLPTILKMTLTGVGSSFFDGLSGSIAIQQRIDIVMFSFHRMQGAWPETVTVSTQWRDALNNAALYSYEGHAGEPTVMLQYANQDLEKILCE